MESAPSGACLGLLVISYSSEPHTDTASQEWCDNQLWSQGSAAQGLSCLKGSLQPKAMLTLRGVVVRAVTPAVLVPGMWHLDSSAPCSTPYPWTTFLRLDWPSVRVLVRAVAPQPLHFLQGPTMPPAWGVRGETVGGWHPTGFVTWWKKMVLRRTGRGRVFLLPHQQLAHSTSSWSCLVPALGCVHWAR